MVTHLADMASTNAPSYPIPRWAGPVRRTSKYRRTRTVFLIGNDALVEEVGGPGRRAFLIAIQVPDCVGLAVGRFVEWLTKQAATSAREPLGWYRAAVRYQPGSGSYWVAACRWSSNFEFSA